MDKFSKVLHVVLDEQEFAYLTGVSFAGLSVNLSEDGYRVVVRGTTRQGDAVYAVSVGEGLSDVVVALLGALGGRDGGGYWRPDRFRQ
jgi:hypothetical protein